VAWDTSTSTTEEAAGAAEGQAGEGSLRWEFVREYAGEWRGSMRHGLGVATTTDGAQYKGSWVEDEFQREGAVGASQIDQVRYVGACVCMRGVMIREVHTPPCVDRQLPSGLPV
jgi:hypothetical protein